MKKTKMFLEQKSVIIDEENRIIRIKASTGDFDREQDRINPKGWKLSEYTIPFIDAHKSSGSYDGRLGEVVKGYEENGVWYNDVKLDKPSDENPNAWTDGEKLANRVWNLIKEGKDISVSVGFLPDENGIKKNSNGGYDFQSQEQYELSIVLAPCNPKAGTKSMNKFLEENKNKSLEELIKSNPKLEEAITKAFIDTEIPINEIPLRKLLKDKIEEVLKFDDIYIWSDGVYTDHVVFSQTVYDNGYYEYKNYQIGYSVLENNITLGNDLIEVKPMEIWVQEKEDMEVMKSIKKDFTSIKEFHNKSLELVKELEILKKVEEETPNTVVKKFNFTKKVKKANFKKEDNK